MLEMKNPPLKIITLPVSGLELEICRVDVKTIGFDAAMTYAARAGLLGEAQAHMALGMEIAKPYAKNPPREDLPPRHPPRPNRAQVQADLENMSEKAIIKAALTGTRNSFEELLSAFHTTEDKSDLGMGADYHTLVDLIVEHSGFRVGVSALPPEEAETFPRTVGPKSGWNRPQVWEAAQRSAGR